MGIRIAPEDRARTRVLLADTAGLVLAASDRSGLLTEWVTCNLKGRASGVDRDPETGAIMAFDSIPDNETYRDLGGYGLIL